MQRVSKQCVGVGVVGVCVVQSIQSSSEVGVGEDLNHRQLIIPFAQSVLGGKRFVHIGRQCACLHISDTSQSEEVRHGRGVVVSFASLNVAGESVEVSPVEGGRLVGIVVEPKSKSSAVEG